MPKVLVKGFRVMAELHALEVVRPDAHSEAVEPRFFVEHWADSDGFRTPSGIAAPRLVN